MRKFYFFALLLSGIAVFADPIAERQTFFRNVDKNPGSARQYLSHKDPEIRRYAAYLVLKNNPADWEKIVEKLSADPDENVRITVISRLPQIASKNKKIHDILLKVAQTDPSSHIRKIAVRATWPFHREVWLIRNDPTWDQAVTIVKRIPLENLPWLFTLDPMGDGHLKGFFKKNCNTAKWKSIKMGVWENQGYPDYNGVAWYQIKFTMPEKIDHNAVEVVFDSVDDAAWVWLNGVYLGCHDIGSEGWNIPFSLDCRKEIRWGKENVLTVRVGDSGSAGGIYKPVRIEVIK